MTSKRARTEAADLISELTPHLAEGEGKSERGPSQATTLVEIAGERYRLLLGDDGQPYAVAKDGPNIALPLRGNGGLRAQLAKEFTDRCDGAVPTSSALTDALTVLTGRAEAGEPEPVALRIGQLDSRTVLDLGTADGRCVVIEPGRWAVEQCSPLLFRRTRLTGVLPTPTTDGDLAGLRQLVNVDEDGWWLLVAWLVAALLPEIPHPILALFGLQGTAKSTATKMLVRLFDPSPVLTRSAPKDVKSWSVTANASWAVALDNVSNIAPWFSDALCKAVTGDGIVDRALYTDTDVSVIAFRRVIALNGIDAGDLAGDLAERLLSVELERIPESRRREEREIWQAYEEVQPAALGALLDLVAAVLEVLPYVEPGPLPRMADFFRVLTALDSVTGWHSVEAYRGVAESTQELVVDSDTFALAVRDLAWKHGEWTGTPTALHELLTPKDLYGKPKPPAKWPASLKAMSGRLKRLLPALESLGVAVSFSRGTDKRRTRLITIKVDPAHRADSASDDLSEASDLSVR